jgi:uncharacterized protein DUF4337
MSQPTLPAATPPPEHPEPPKTLWERIITSTPIVLTVVATVLAGLSSSEMTRAQYYRALAAQYQSKVSDQWNFFQAKRIRGTSTEMTIDVLHSMTEPGEVSPAALRAAADRLPEDLRRAEQQAERLVKAVNAARGDGSDLGPAGEQLLKAAGDLKESAGKLSQAAVAARAKVVAALGDEKVSATFTFLNSKKLPAKEGEADDPRKALDTALGTINPPIPAALREVGERKTERQMAATLAGITEDQVHQAIDDAETRAADNDKLGKSVADTYRTLDGLITGQGALVREFHRAVRQVDMAVAALPAGDAKGLNDVRLAAAAVARTGAELKASADGLANDFKAALLDFNARRYERESRYNEVIAGLYELDVRKASIDSDRHRDRSKQFFNAMLAAQAGVTIATFSLAVRFRSALWALATVAGVTALAIGAYVYLRM